MISPDMLALITIVGSPTMAAFGVVGGAWVGRRAGLRQADTATKQAATEATRVVTVAWQSYAATLLQDAEDMRKDRTLLEGRLEAVELRATAAERRLDTSERRAKLSEERADRAESLYRIAINYLRGLFAWATDSNRVGDIPEPPYELRADL